MKYVGVVGARWLDERSRPARGAWVEIINLHTGVVIVCVAPRKGRVG